MGRNGFLHISDVESQYFRQGGFDPDRPIERDGTQLPAEKASAEKTPVDENVEFDSDADEGFEEEEEEETQRRRRPGPRPGARPRIKPPIQDIFQRGDEVLVQVIKEGIGSKGPTLSTYISIPGRYLVLMPALGRVGVSRKIEDEDDRRRLRDILRELNSAQGARFYRSPRRARTERRRSSLAIWLICCDCGK